MDVTPLIVPESFLRDCSNFVGEDSALFRPQSIEEMQKLVARLWSEKTSFTVSGAKTGLVGGCVPKEGVVISTENLTKLKLNVDENYVYCEVGVSVSKVQSLASSVSLFYPPNPTETSSSIGGNCSTNASGSRSFRYGSTKDNIVEMQVMLPNGDIEYVSKTSVKFVNTFCKHLNQIKENASLKNSIAGAIYAANDVDFFAGSEGSLGIILGAKLRLLPSPEKVIGFMAFFDSYDSALDFVENIQIKTGRNVRKLTCSESAIGVKIEPRLVEFLDLASLGLNSNIKIPEKSQCAIWIEQETNLENSDLVLTMYSELFEQFLPTHLQAETIVATNEAENRKLREFRASIPQSIAEKIRLKKMQKIGIDFAVPPENFRKYFRFAKRCLQNSNVEHYAFGHIGDAHIHINLFHGNREAKKICLQVYEEILHYAISLGGTLSGEHGIGKIKKEYFKIYCLNEYQAIREIKGKLDPNFLLNRGTLIDV